MMCLIKSCRDVEEEEEERGVWGCCSERYGLPSSVRVVRQMDLQSKKKAFTHPGTLFFSFPFPLWTRSQLHTRREREKKRGLAVFLYSLAGDPEAEPGGRETQLLFPVAKPSALANEKRERPIRFHCGQTTRLSWLRDHSKCCGRCSHTTCIVAVCFRRNHWGRKRQLWEWWEFLSISSNLLELKSIISGVHAVCFVLLTQLLTENAN